MVKVDNTSWCSKVRTIGDTQLFVYPLPERLSDIALIVKFARGIINVWLKCFSSFKCFSFSVPFRSSFTTTICFYKYQPSLGYNNIMLHLNKSKNYPSRFLVGGLWFAENKSHWQFPSKCFVKTHKTCQSVNPV